MMRESTPDEQKRRFGELCERLLNSDADAAGAKKQPTAQVDDLLEPPGKQANDNMCEAD